MTIFFLVRHAQCDAVGSTFAGRMPNVRLNERGRAQTLELGQRFAGLRLDSVVSSPLERARETATAIAGPQGMGVEIAEGLAELDAGEWTGCAFRDLDDVPAWQRFNSFRSCTRIPGGELMLEAQVRIIAELERLRARYPSGNVVVVSHGDMLRAAVAHYAGVHLDLFQRIELSPCSVTAVAVGDQGPRILRVNDTGALASVRENLQ